MTPSQAASTPPFRRAAGVAVPLFALRGSHDAGTGEILDLVPFIDWLAGWHQGVVQLLPINETAASETSPYNTLSAFAFDPAYISAQDVVDVKHSRAAREWLASSPVQGRLGRARRSRRRQRRTAYPLKLRLLELGFEVFEKLPAADRRLHAFEDFCRTNTAWLDDYALFRALKEQRRWTSWETWPEPLRVRTPAALAAAAHALRRRVRFFRYVQWIAAEQWKAVRAHARRRGVLIKGDLPFVCGRDSADVWAHQELFDLSSSAGAPPDAFSSTGQAWGLPLYDWPGLRRSGWEWWRQRARQARQLYDLVRVDHVVGLFRTYAIPVREGGTAGFVPDDEAAQLEQGQQLLTAVVEAARPAAVIAEDLGSVPAWVREVLTQIGIPGYKVFRWERQDGVYAHPSSYPALSVATTGTHDTDTLAEWWGTLAADEHAAVVSSLLDGQNGAPQDATLPWTPELHLRLLRRLYEATSVLTIVPIQDLFGWRERINTPATVGPANWTYRLPTTADRLDQRPGVGERMAAIRALIDASGRWVDIGSV